uniref:Transposase n=1 Tax=Heterorhabditis bacteriophora TaxID=37862 RepID=A0A1I7X562_HETBA
MDTNTAAQVKDDMLYFLKVVHVVT